MRRTITLFHRPSSLEARSPRLTGEWTEAGLSLLVRHGAFLVVLASSLYFLVSIVVGKGYVLLTEDHLFEYWTAALYLAAALICAFGASIAGGVSAKTRYWLIGWGILFLLIALAELSWGQRIFGVDTPGFLLSRNLQKETNIHNLDSELANRTFASLAFAVGVALPSLALVSGRFNSFIKRIGVPLPPGEMAVPFSLAFAFAVPVWVVSAPETEVLTGLAFLWFSLVLVAKWTGSQAPATRLNTPHLLFGLTGIVAIQLVLWLFEESLGHRSHPSEIKEFLFSVCFVVFALGVALPVSGKAVARLRLPKVYTHRHKPSNASGTSEP